MVLIWPVAETGVMDDWSYVFTAQELAHTGRVLYNGWSTALLGWPLFVAAGAVRVFGASFLVVRLTTMLEALVCVFVLHRLLLRSGLSRANAVVGTLLVSVSPLFLYLGTSFMSDVPGLLAVVVCLYACLRALAASSETSSRLWIAVAAFSNALLGSARQIAWLGVLVMVPCTVWLLRRRRRVWVEGGIVIAAMMVVFLILHWYTTQTYAVPEKLFQERPTLGGLGHLVQVGVASLLDTGLLLLPLGLSLVRSAGRLRGWRRFLLVTVILGGTVFGSRAVHQHHGERYMVPALRYSKVTNPSIESLFAATTAPPKGPAPRPLLPRLQGIGSLFAAASMVGLLAAALLSMSQPERPVTVGAASPSYQEILWLTVPYVAAYCFLLTPRGLSSWLFDRYLLLLLPCFAVLALRWYQEYVAVTPTLFTRAALAMMAAFSIFSAHDFYAGYRASVLATREIEAAGVARTAIDGGWEYNHYTELLVNGHVRQVGMRLPDGSILQTTGPDVPTPPCSLEAQPQTPHVHPRFALAYPGSGCTPVPGFAPVAYRAWLPPMRRTLLVVYADR